MAHDPYGDLVAARPDDRFLRFDVSPRRVERAHVRGRAVAWTSTHPFRGVRWLTAVADDPGSAAEVATCLSDAVAGGGMDVHGITVPSRAQTALAPGLRSPAPERWSWWWTEDSPQRRPGEAEVVLLDPADPRIPILLAHSTSASAEPGDPKIRRWAGLVEGQALVACACHTEHQPGVPHLASVVTHPDHRGHGLAGDLCAWLTRTALDEGAPVVTLGMYADNAAARRVYQGLGFVEEVEFASGYLPGHAPPPDAGPDEAPADGAGTA
jgi:GNAT superfamily N-acetyltransferase